MVAWSLTFLAHGFGIVRALQPHRQAVGEKSRAIRAQGDLLLLDLFDIEKFKLKGRPVSVVVLLAVDPYKLHQSPNIVSFLL